MVDYPPADRKTKNEILRTLEAVEQNQSSVSELTGLLEISGTFTSGEEVMIACEELAEAGKIEEVETDREKGIVYRLARE